jgi:hypothetical protein
MKRTIFIQLIYLGMFTLNVTKHGFKKRQKICLEDKSPRNLECNFNTSGDTVIHPDDMQWLFENIKDPIYRTGYDRNFWIWEKYQEGASYVLVADVARGDGADYSVFHIIKFRYNGNNCRISR